MEFKVKYILLLSSTNLSPYTGTTDTLALIKRTSRLWTTLFQRSTLSVGQYPRVRSTGVTIFTRVCCTPPTKECRPWQVMISERWFSSSTSDGSYQPKQKHHDDSKTNAQVSLLPSPSHISSVFFVSLQQTRWCKNAMSTACWQEMLAEFVSCL